MALQLSHRATGGGAGVVGQLVMNGSEELEEGEASEANDSNSGDLCFPQIEDKLMEVLGHVRKDFEGALYAEKLGCRYGLYGTFLHTGPVPVPPPPLPPPQGRRMPSPYKQNPAPPSPANQEMAKSPPKMMPSEPEVKKTSSITVRIKVGSESRGKNSEIYNKLGFSSSPSVSEDDEDESASESPSGSPHSMIQEVLSDRLPLLSPLPNGFLPPPREEPRKIKIKDSSKETRDMEIDSKPVKKQEVRKADIGRSARREDSKGKSQEPVSSAGKSVAKRESRGESAPARHASKSNREDSTSLEIGDFKASKPLEIGEGSLDKRKQKDTEPERLKKRHKPNSSSGSIDANSSKETKKPRKQAMSEENPPLAKPKEEKKKPLKLTQSKAAPEASDTAKREQMHAPKDDDQRQKLKGGKTKASRKSNYTELFGSDPPADFSTMEQRHTEPLFLPEPAVVPPVLIKENWVQCELCHKWRLLPPSMDPPSDNESWQCQMITWLLPGMNSCRVPEEETTARVYESLGIQPPVDPLAAVGAAAPFIPPPAAVLPPPEKTSSKSRLSDSKLGKHVAKKERPKYYVEAGDDFYSTKEADAKDMSKKKRRATTEEQHVSKKLKAGDTKRSDRKYMSADVSNENVEATRQNEIKVQKKAGEKDKRPLDMGRSREEEREEHKEVSRSFGDHAGKSLKSSKTSKSKAVRVGEEARSSEQLIKVKPSSAKQVHDTIDQKKKKSSGSQATSPCNSFDVEFSNHDRDGRKNEARSAYDGEGQRRTESGGYPSRSKPVVDEDNVRHSNASPLEDTDRKHYRDTNDRHRDGNDPDRSIDKWERRVSSEAAHLRDEKGSKKNTKRSEGRASLENDRVRLKEVDAVKAEQEEQHRQDVSRLQSQKAPEDEVQRDIRRELDEKKDASAVIKDAKDLKHLADRLKGTDLYLQAGLKFMQGAALVPSVVESSQLYTDTAALFKFCVSKYEQSNDTVGAVLAYKCAAVARFRLLQLKNPSTSKDRADVLVALRPPAPNHSTPNGDSPSSSSASDLVDNLNSQEKILSSGGKGAVSPLFQGSTSAVQHQLLRLLKTSECVVEAFDSSGKAESLLAVLVSSKALSPEKLAAVEKVVQIGFGDVEKVVHLVNQALKALGR